MSWHAVDRAGLDLATGRPPGRGGAPSPACALASAPLMAWPAAVVDDAGARVPFASALGPGGERIEQLLDGIASTGPPPPLAPERLAALAGRTPAGKVRLPVAVVPVAVAARCCGAVDGEWLATVEARRAEPRPALAAAGRGEQLEAALHVAMLVATAHLDPVDDADVDDHVASGAVLWLLGGVVAWALLGSRPDPFAAWAELLAHRLWPVGPVDGRLVVVELGPRLLRGASCDDFPSEGGLARREPGGDRMDGR